MLPTHAAIPELHMLGKEPGHTVSLGSSEHPFLLQNSDTWVSSPPAPRPWGVQHSYHPHHPHHLWLPCSTHRPTSSSVFTAPKLPAECVLHSLIFLYFFKLILPLLSPSVVRWCRLVMICDSPLGFAVRLQSWVRDSFRQCSCWYSGGW